MNQRKTALQRIGWRWGLWLPALLLLSNANLHALDLLPDFIAYGLLLVAIRRLAFMDAGFAEVAKAFRRMMLLSVARVVGLVWVYTATAAYEQPTLILSLCFVLGVLELMIVLPACRQLFSSLSYLATRQDGTLVFESSRARKVARLTAKLNWLEQTGGANEARRKAVDRKLRRLSRRPATDVSDRVCRSCQIFAIAKTAFCVLPEFAALAHASYDAGVIHFNWYAYINGFRAMAFVLVLIFGIVWLCRTISYCSHIAKDTPFWERVAALCEEDADLHPERKPNIRLRRAMTLLAVGFAFLINLRLDGINFVPGFVTPVAFLLALICIGRYLPRALCVLCSATFVFQGAVLTYTYVQAARFFGEFDLALYNINWNVRQAYATNVVGTAWPETIVQALSLIAVGAMLFCLIDRYTKPVSAATHQYTADQLSRARRGQIKRYLLFPAVLSVLMMAARLVNCYMLPKVEMIWLLDFFAAAIFAVFAALRVFAVKDELRPELMASFTNES